MCRMLFRAGIPLDPKAPLLRFADLCHNTPSPIDGSLSADGWGIAWLDDEGRWDAFKSVKPVWEDADRFREFRSTRAFLVHARSKSFETDLLTTDYNQPLIEQGLAFAFNGEMRGVRLPAPGRFGAEKIFRLVQRFSSMMPPERALAKVRDQLKVASKQLNAANVVLASGNQVQALCLHDDRWPEYYALRIRETRRELMICSQNLDPKTDWQSMPNGGTVSYDLPAGDRGSIVRAS